MTMQIAVAAMFGIGLLTVATISLLNFVCLRLFEVQKKDEEIEDVANQHWTRTPYQVRKMRHDAEVTSTRSVD